jgi:hypothetical protein
MASFYDNLGCIVYSVDTDVELLKALIEKYTNDGFSYINPTLSPAEYYIENGEGIKKPNRPSILHDFDYSTKTWKLPTDNINGVRKYYKELINNLTGNTILTKYPDYSQRNILASGDADLITEAWDYINSIRDLSNSANDTISSAQDTQEIEAIYQDYLTQLMEL